MRQSEAEALLDAVSLQGFRIAGQRLTVESLKAHLTRFACEIRRGEVKYRRTVESPRAYVAGALVEELSRD